LTAIPRSSASGDEGSASRASRVCGTGRARVARAVFPPEQVAEVVAVACELPAAHDRPLSRFSRTELHRLVIEQGVTEASASTIWRWLHDRSLKPWQQRSWIFPRDPDFQAKAGRVLDLYARRSDGALLHPGDFVVCADEKSQLQALGRRHPTVAAAPGRPGLVEFEYRRGGQRAVATWWRDPDSNPGHDGFRSCCPLGAPMPVSAVDGDRNGPPSGERQDSSRSSFNSHMSTEARVPGVSAGSIALNA
jgi:hypothetical protein